MLYRKTKLVDQQRQELVFAIEDIEDSDLPIDDKNEFCEYAETLLKGFDMAVSGFMPVNG